MPEIRPYEDFLNELVKRVAELLPRLLDEDISVIPGEVLMSITLGTLPSSSMSTLAQPESSKCVQTVRAISRARSATAHPRVPERCTRSSPGIALP